MTERKDKKFYRELKRTVKQNGNKKRRSYYKKNLEKNPEEAHFCEEFDFGDCNSKQFNGMDGDKSKGDSVGENEINFSRGKRDGFGGLNPSSTSKEYMKGYLEGRREREEHKLQYPYIYDEENKEH